MRPVPCISHREKRGFFLRSGDRDSEIIIMIMAKWRRGRNRLQELLHVSIIERSGLDPVPTDGFLVDGQ